MPTVAIIGAGPLGRWLAARAAEAGCNVFLEDVMPLNLRHAKEELRTQLNEAALPRVTFTSTLDDALRSADLAIDCVPDELESKLEIFCLMDRMAPPRTVFATPSVNQSIADLASCTYRADKCIAILRKAATLTNAQDAEDRQLPLVTLRHTSDEAIHLVREFWMKLGFKPTVQLDPNEGKLVSNP